jgi:dipeptidyl aminopeptidase/acylaminoacyl peptidase
MPKNTARIITAEDLYRFQIITDMELSPDGNQIIYAVQTVDKSTEKKYTHLWLVDTQSKKTRQITFGKHSNIHPRWSPDSQSIAFLSNRENEKQFQFYLLCLEGGDARPITCLEGEIDSFEWSQDGKRIVFQFRKTDKDVLERAADEQKEKLGVVYRQIDRLFYQLDNYGYLPKERWHIWILDVQKEKATQLTNHLVFDELEPHWAPDGKSIAYFSNHEHGPDHNPDSMDIFIFSLVDGKERKITTQPGPKNLLSFSPDGTQVAYVGIDGINLDWRNNNLWVSTLDDPQTCRNLTKSEDLNLCGLTLNDIGGAQLKPPVWSTDMKFIYFQVARHGNTSLWRIDLETTKLTPFIQEKGVVSLYNFDQSQEKLAYVIGKENDPAQIILKEPAHQKKERQLTALNPWLQSLQLGEIEEVWFKGAAGNGLQGWIVKPPNFNPETRYPSILEIHGGPMLQYGNFFTHEFQYLAANGYVVFLCNPRGGQGYGEEHTKAIHGQWGTVDYDDLMAWCDYVEKLPYIDIHRMGVTGGSYGGYMTNWIIGHTHRFRAAVTQRSVSNLISMWGSSDFNWEFQRTFGNKAPYESIETLWECSPLKHIGYATTPTLVLHSERDLRCPLEQGQQIFTALKCLNIDTELILFPEEPHGLSRTGRTDRRIARLFHILRWFDRYLK